MSSFSMSRRSLLRAAAAASVASSLPLAAAPQTRRRAIALVVTRGGLNALHATPDTLLGHFGTTPDSMLPTGTGLFVDKATLGAFPAVALSHMAVVGVDAARDVHFEPTQQDRTLSWKVRNPRLTAAIRESPRSL